MAQQKRKKKKLGIVKTIGRAFLGDVRYGDINLPFFSYVMILIVVGLVMMSSASYVWANEKEGDGLFYAKKQMFAALLGFVVMIFLAGMDYHNFKKIKIPGLKKLNIAGLLYIFGLLLLILVFIMGTDEGGSMEAKRWLVIGPVNFQPSEVTKFTLVIYFAYRMERKSDEMKTFSGGILTYGILLAPYAVCILLQPHISGFVLICVIAASLIICGGANKWWLISIAVVGIVGIAWFINWQGGIEGSYVATRLKSWHDPFADVLNDTWQTAHSLIAIGSGGLFGLGFGNSRQKYLYLPEAQNDFIFPIVCEELGFIGSAVVILLLILIAMRCVSIARVAKDTAGMVIAAGIGALIGIQGFMNIAVATMMMPNTGLPLPFVSYGLSSLVSMYIGIGFVLNVGLQRKNLYNL